VASRKCQTALEERKQLGKKGNMWGAEGKAGRRRNSWGAEVNPGEEREHLRGNMKSWGGN
jgi:hypothetical protein